MVVQVFVGDIGYHTNVKFAGRYPVLRQSVGSRFEHNMGQPGIYHTRQVALYVGRLRGGDVETGVEHFVANHGINGRDHPRT